MFFKSFYVSSVGEVYMVNMVSVSRLLLILLVFFATVSTGEKKKTNKIVIHVPYKIHKHHHTHTKYKVITIPAPKKENTVIYLKEEIQPVIKHVPHTQTEEIVKTPTKVAEPFIPPHQESAAGYLANTNHKEQGSLQANEQHEYSTILEDQKPLETTSGQHEESFVPHFTYKPIILPSHENLIPNYSFKPFVLPQHYNFMSPIVHHSYNTLIPKYSYHSMMHFPRPPFNNKYTFKPMLPQTKILQDNVALTSSQTYKTIINPRPKSTYKVKEENQEDHSLQPIKPMHPISNQISVPSLKNFRKGKSLAPAHNFKLQSLESIVPTNPDYEYEHVGYLIIDGNSRKIVGKNLKDEINLIR